MWSRQTARVRAAMRSWWRLASSRSTARGTSSCQGRSIRGSMRLPTGGEALGDHDRAVELRPSRSEVVMLTGLSSLELALVVAAITFGATGLGIWIGRALFRGKSGLKEPLGVMQAALVGLVALLLAFGLTMAVGRYRGPARRGGAGSERHRHHLPPRPDARGTDANRVARPAETIRRRSHRPVGIGSGLGKVPRRRRRRRSSIQNRLWALAGDALNTAPTASAPRLYVETLNEMIDAHTTRIAALDNRIPHRCSGCRSSRAHLRSASSACSSPRTTEAYSWLCSPPVLSRSCSS